MNIRKCTPGPTLAITSPDMSSEGDGERTIGQQGYVVTPELKVNPSVPHGVVTRFTMSSADSKIYPGVNGPYTRNVWVYVPFGYVPGTPLPFIVVQDGAGYSDDIPNVLDSLIPGKCLPKMAAIMVDNGGGDAPGSERSFEYDTVSDAYGRFLLTEVFPRAEAEGNVVLSTDPEAGAAMGGSSGGPASFGLAWFHPERFRRIITYSGSYIYLFKDKMYPYGAWEYHTNLIPKSEPKPLRVWLNSSSGDWGPDTARLPQLDAQTANKQMYATLTAKGLHVQHNFAPNAGHNDPIVMGATVVDALIWLWRGYPIE
ncbi:MAG: alpha/beta hydrolase-fold protein [Polyangiaceae bacterium]|nr:alpha/beta hydrolase-fold protein [Polyangiaceae bacterium]